jgi:hypothetical protein
MASHVGLLSSLDRSARLRFWHTEQPPFTDRLPSLTSRLAGGRFEVERRLRRPIRQLGRLRVLGEMRYALHAFPDFSMSVFSRAAADLYAAMGIPARVVPIGCYPELGTDFGQPLAERPIDVLFIGASHRRRRRRVLIALARQFEVLGLRFEIVDGSRLGGPALYGAERTALLNRTKLVLSIGQNESDDHIFRSFLSGANHCALFCDALSPSQTAPFVAGQHLLVEPDLARLPARIEQWLRNEMDHVQATADQLREAVLDLPMAKQITAVLE